jgi:hypothetical protein
MKTTTKYGGILALSGKNIHWILLLSLFLLLTVLSFLSEGFYGGSDNIAHYFLSRYSFQYPELFFNTWGRPFFTIMSSPFSQFGFMGIKFFNVLQGCLTAYLAFLIARKIGITRPWLAILFTIFTPMYFLMTMTGLTEIQFGLILLLSVFLFLDEKYIVSAIVISFLPISRSEGIVILPIFFIAYLLRRKLRPIPFLATGFLLFSVAGYFVYHDFFWLLTHSPYPLHHPLYKTQGPLLHFIQSTPEIFGYPLLILFLAGIVIYSYQFFRTKKEVKLQMFLEIWLLLIPVLLLFAVHSVLYWKALFGSMGLIRVITGVLPLAALISLKAFDFIEKTVLQNKYVQSGFLGIVLGCIVWWNFSINTVPVQLHPMEKVVKTSSEWIQQSAFSERKIFFTHNFTPYFLELVPYDNKKCDLPRGSKLLKVQPEGSLLVWDSYFGPSECCLPSDSIDSLKVFRLINLFSICYNLKPGYKKPFEVRLYIKTNPGSIFHNDVIRDSIIRQKSESGSFQFLSGETYEKPQTAEQASRVSKEKSYAGAFSYKVGVDEQFGCYHEFPLPRILSKPEEMRIRVTCFVYPIIPFKENDTRLVINIVNHEEYYQCAIMETIAPLLNQWNYISFTANFPKVNLDDKLVVYFWHLGKKEFFVDDLKIEKATVVQ